MESGARLIQQKTVDVLRALWARQGIIPRRLWDRELWLAHRVTHQGLVQVGVFGITRNGLVTWLEEKKKHESSLEDFIRSYTGTLDEAEIRRQGREFLLLSVPIEQIRLKDLVNCQNAEIRGLVFRRCGNQVYLHDGGARVVDLTDDARLLKINTRGFETAFYILEVQDSTSRNKYLLRVPSTMRSCREAVAWTFGLRPEEYQPIKET